MGELSNISGKKAIKVFTKFGYTISRQSGSHIILSHSSRPTLSIPNHKELSPFLLKSQIKKSGLNISEFVANK
jgi:predicted RNA binding protein YcfA (HicA-like mRNA interferase family)